MHATFNHKMNRWGILRFQLESCLKLAAQKGLQLGMLVYHRGETMLGGRVVFFRPSFIPKRLSVNTVNHPQPSKH